MEPGPRERLSSLDGIRGVAAVVVAIHHALLLVPPLAAAYFTPVAVTGFTAALIYSPLHIVWAGTEAVYLFFVLSGVVLTLATRRADFRWERYYPSRAVRLYLPVIGAVLFAAATIALVPHDARLQSPWMAHRSESYPLSSMVQDMLLIDGTSGIVSPLWSLQWEVLFSLSLPLYVVLARSAPLWLQLMTAVGLSTVGMAINPALAFMPMFGIGVALAHHWDGLRSRADRISKRRGSAWFWGAALLASIALTTAYWIAWPLTRLSRAWTLPLVLAGVTMIILTAAFSPQLRAVLSSRVARWLGRVSFSLYLVHEPIIVAVGFMLPESPWAPPVALVAAVGLAWVFYRVVERPSHRLAQWLARPRTPPETGSIASSPPLAGN